MFGVIRSADACDDGGGFQIGLSVRHSERSQRVGVFVLPVSQQQ
jgi:hypothetical protein